MKIDLNDPRITAFALGELKGQDAIEIARAVRNDSRVRAAVDEVRDTSGMLMDVLGGGEAHLLTPEQRDTVRKAGSSPVITDISSARVPFWKRPAVAGVGVAAAVAMMIYYIGGRPGAGPAGGSPDTLENPATWDWAAVDLESLTLPADPAGVLDSEPSRSSDALHAVSAAISDNTTRFRRELSERIEQLEPGEISSAKSLPELDRDASQPWRSVEKGKPIPVPLASGATSWPWIKRSIMEQKKLPPPRAVRIEEMINHFRYQKPGMVKGSGVVADMELCDTPWNPLTMLLAVHVSVDPDAGDAAGITGPVYLEINPERVGRVRLLGYAQLKHSGQKKSSGPAKLSRSQGNYVIYELENQDAAERSAVVATLHLGQEGSQAQLPISQKHSWIHASPDLRFASVVSACGILLHQHQGVGELDAGRLLSFVELLEKQDSTRLGGDRREALQLCRKAAGLIGAVSGN